jgi:hypothetical protein
MITIELTPEQLKAVKIAFTEVQNAGDWAMHYSDEEIDNVFDTAKIFDKIKA